MSFERRDTDTWSNTVKLNANFPRIAGALAESSAIHWRVFDALCDRRQRLAGLDLPDPIHAARSVIGGRHNDPGRTIAKTKDGFVPRTRNAVDERSQKLEWTASRSASCLRASAA